jgi:hypothetical protein
MYSEASIKTPTKKASTQLSIVENDGILMNFISFQYFGKWTYIDEIYA